MNYGTIASAILYASEIAGTLWRTLWSRNDWAEDIFWDICRSKNNYWDSFRPLLIVTHLHIIVHCACVERSHGEEIQCVRVASNLCVNQAFNTCTQLSSNNSVLSKSYTKKTLFANNSNCEAS